MANHNYYLQPLPIPALELGELVEINAQLLPWHLRGLQQQKSRAFWATRDDWIAGVKAITIEQERLLMGAKEDIIREIRDARGSIPEGADTTLIAYPVGTYPGIQLADVVGSLNTNGESAAFILAQIRSILQSQQESSGNQLEALGLIASLLMP